MGVALCELPKLCFLMQKVIRNWSFRGWYLFQEYISFWSNAPMRDYKKLISPLICHWKYEGRRDNLLIGWVARLFGGDKAIQLTLVLPQNRGASLIYWWGVLLSHPTLTLSSNHLQCFSHCRRAVLAIFRLTQISQQPSPSIFWGTCCAAKHTISHIRYLSKTHFVRAFPSKNCNFKLWKRSFGASLPSKLQVEVVKTKLSCETFLKNCNLKLWKRSCRARLSSRTATWRLEVVKNFQQK